MRMSEGDRSEVILARPQQSDTAILAFSSRGARHFNYYNVLEPFPASKLLVRDPSDCWYNAGVPGVGETVDQIAERLREELGAMGAKKVFTIGSSMGAYAAILFGCLVGAERVMAFAPQTLLDPMFAHSPPDGVPLQAPDLEPIARSAPSTKIDFVVGWDDPIDVFYYFRLEHLPSVRGLARIGGSHTFIESLGIGLPQIIEDLMGGGAPAGFEVQAPADDEVKAGITESVLAYHRSEYARSASLIAPVADANPSWAGLHFMRGLACFNAWDLDGAEAAFGAAKRANPDWYEPYGYLGRTLIQMKRPADAEPLLRKAAELKPDWARNYLFLGESLLGQGRAEEARAEFDRALELDPGMSTAVKALTQ